MTKAKDFLKKLTGPVTIGMLVRAFRTRNDISQEQLGSLIGQAKSYVSDLERDKKSTSLSQVLDFAEKMGESKEIFAKAWIEKELSEANVDAIIDIKVINGRKSAFSRARNDVIKSKQKAPVVNGQGAIRRATKKKAS